MCVQSSENNNQNNLMQHKSLMFLLQIPGELGLVLCRQSRPEAVCGPRPGPEHGAERPRPAAAAPQRADGGAWGWPHGGIFGMEEDRQKNCGI